MIMTSLSFTYCFPLKLKPWMGCFSRGVSFLFESNFANSRTVLLFKMIAVDIEVDDYKTMSKTVLKSKIFNRETCFYFKISNNTQEEHQPRNLLS